MFKTGPDILALAADMPEPAEVETAADSTDAQAAGEDASNDGSTPSDDPSPPEGDDTRVNSTEQEAAPPAQQTDPVPSTKLGWGASLKALEAAGQHELAAHAKRIQADATHKTQEAARIRAEAEAMLNEARRIAQQQMQSPPPAANQQQAEVVDPWDANALRRMAQEEARRLLEAELAPVREQERKRTESEALARKEAELDAWIEAHPDFAGDQTMQDEVAELLTSAQSKGRFVHLDDAYTVVKARRVKAEAERLQLEAAARAKAKTEAVSKTQAARPAHGQSAAVPNVPRKPASHLSAQDILAIAKQS